MRIRATSSLALAALAAFAAAARAQTISGVVVEDVGHARISGAFVSIERVGGGQGATVTTDSTGAFVAAVGDPGRFVLRVTHPSYTTIVSDTIQVEEEEAVTLELRLAPHAVPLEPLVVTARVNKELREFRLRAARGGFGHFMTRPEVERRHASHVTQLLFGFPGVELAAIPPCRGCSPDYMITMRGGANRCVATVLIDGLAMRQDISLPIDAILTPESLEGVEVYVDPATVPAALGIVPSSCGVVAFWTHEPEGGRFSWKRLGITLGIAVVLFMILR